MNDYVDRIIVDEEKMKTLDHGNQLAENVNQKFLLENDFMQQIYWTEFIGLDCQEWLKLSNGRELKHLQFIKSWVVMTV